MDSEYPAIVTWAGLLVPVVTALLALRPSQSAAGPRRLRRIQRIVDQAAVLQETTDKHGDPSRSSPLLGAATAQQQEALLEELGLLRHPFGPYILIIALGLVYMSIGLTENVEQGEGALLTIAGIAIWLFGLLSLVYQGNFRRGIVLRGRSAFPLMSPLQQHFNEECRASFRQKELRKLAKRRLRDLRRRPAQNQRARKSRPPRWRIWKPTKTGSVIPPLPERSAGMRPQEQPQAIPSKAPAPAITPNGNHP